MMIICHNCFKDEILKAAVSSNACQEGICGSCRKTGKLYDTDSENYLEDQYFSAFLDIFTLVSEKPNFPSEQGRLLQTEVTNNWDIFESKDESEVYCLLKAICKDRFASNRKLFEEKIAIIFDDEYKRKNALLNEGTWGDFVNDLKYENRFHSKYFNLELFANYCSFLSKSYKKGATFYRCRIADGMQGFSKNEMGAPPKGKSSDGRVNAKGVNVLYLGDSDKTVIHETRAGKYDYVCIGTFRSQDLFTVVDFKSINRISPFMDGIIEDIKKLALNKKVLKQMNDEMGKVMRRNDDVLSYVPTQYVADFIRSITNDNGQNVYSDIEYSSVMNNSGYNIAMFDTNKFKCTQTSIKQINQIVFDYE